MIEKLKFQTLYLILGPPAPRALDKKIKKTNKTMDLFISLNNFNG